MKSWLSLSALSIFLATNLNGIVTANNDVTFSSGLVNLAQGNDTQMDITDSFSYSSLPYPLNASYPGGASGATTYLDPEGFILLINGNNQTITSTGNTRGFFARGGGGGSVTIQNLTINGAVARGGNGGNGGAGGGGLGAGGALFVHAGATVTVKNVSFQNCQAIGGNAGSGTFNGSGGGEWEEMEEKRESLEAQGVADLAVTVGQHQEMEEEVVVGMTEVEE